MSTKTKAIDGATNKIAKLCGRDRSLRFVCCECHPFGHKERAIGWRRFRRASKQLLTTAPEPGAGEQG